MSNIKQTENLLTEKDSSPNEKKKRGFLFYLGIAAGATLAIPLLPIGIALLVIASPFIAIGMTWVRYKEYKMDKYRDKYPKMMAIQPVSDEENKRPVAITEDSITADLNSTWDEKVKATFKEAREARASTTPIPVDAQPKTEDERKEANERYKQEVSKIASNRDAWKDRIRGEVVKSQAVSDLRVPVQSIIGGDETVQGKEEVKVVEKDDQTETVSFNLSGKDKGKEKEVEREEPHQTPVSELESINKEIGKLKREIEVLRREINNRFELRREKEMNIYEANMQMYGTNESFSALQEMKQRSDKASLSDPWVRREAHQEITDKYLELDKLEKRKKELVSKPEQETLAPRDKGKEKEVEKVMDEEPEVAPWKKAVPDKEVERITHYQTPVSELEQIEKKLMKLKEDKEHARSEYKDIHAKLKEVEKKCADELVELDKLADSGEPLTSLLIKRERLVAEKDKEIGELHSKARQLISDVIKIKEDRKNLIERGRELNAPIEPIQPQQQEEPTIQAQRKEPTEIESQEPVVDAAAKRLVEEGSKRYAKRVAYWEELLGGKKGIQSAEDFNSNVKDPRKIKEGEPSKTKERPSVFSLWPFYRGNTKGSASAASSSTQQEEVKSSTRKKKP